MDNGPWFRRVGLSFWPVNLKGWAAMAGLVLVELPLFQLLSKVPERSVSWWLLTGVGVAVFAGFMLFVMVKTKVR